MKERISYIIGALIIYFIAGILVSYFGNSSIDWKFVIIWMLGMSVFDYFIIRNMKRWISQKNKKV